MPGLYIHIPFCVRKCFYCDFYSLPRPLSAINEYISAVLVEARQYRGMSFSTLYFGGGTPSLLGASGLARLMDGLRIMFDFSDLSEATLEVNPDSTIPELLHSAAQAGINRLSIGVQSLSDHELHSVGRIHTSAQAVESICLAQKEHFQNISADAILGLPGQDWQSLMVTLETLIGLGVQHLSLYCLALEPHTPLADNIPPDLPSEDEQADFYENASALMAQRGFGHYEISNFALPGRECQHNLNYWRGGEYLGLGPAAASHLKGRRFKNKADLDSYLRNPSGQIEEVEELSPARKSSEEAILRLRLLSEGLDISELAERFGDENVLSLTSRLDKLVKDGRLLRQDSKYSLAPSQVLVCNPILADLLEDQ
jgi:oxygen-independent coproporphyrinogen III oxidase